MSCRGMLSSDPRSGVSACPPMRSSAVAPKPKMTSGRYRSTGLSMSGLLPAHPPAVEERHQECDPAHEGKRDHEQQPAFRDVHEPFAKLGIDEVHQEAGEKYPDAIDCDRNRDRREDE